MKDEKSGNVGMYVHTIFFIALNNFFFQQQQFFFSCIINNFFFLFQQQCNLDDLTAAPQYHYSRNQ